MQSHLLPQVSGKPLCDITLLLLLPIILGGWLYGRWWVSRKVGVRERAQRACARERSGGERFYACARER